MRTRARCVTLCHALVFGAVAAALLTRPVSAEDLPRTPDELWQRIPSYDVQPSDDSDTKFCRTMLRDLRQNPERFERIPPELETDHFDDSRLHEALPGCSRKELTFSQGRNPIRNTIVNGYYYDEGFAVWPLSSMNPSFPDNVSMVWKGPEYSFQDDDDEYLKPDKRSGLGKVYSGYGRILAYKPKTCKRVKGYGASTLASYEQGFPKIRNMFFAKYGGDLFMLDFSPEEKGESAYISSWLFTPNTPKPFHATHPKNCAYFAR